MATNPTLLVQPIAANGSKNVIPNTTTTAGAMSQDQGFPAETSLPLGAGGVAPSREDFNGAFNLLSAQNFMTQKGWIYTFDAGQSYYEGCIVRDTTDGNIYECINDVAAGGSVPSADSVNWKPFKESGQLYLRKNSTAYAVGDIAYDENLPSYMHLLCTTGGTTDSTEPDFTGAAIGGTISDGTVVWTYSTNYDMERDFTIIYPNGGSAGSPANITINSRYVETNPFPGYDVVCRIEVYTNSKWQELNKSYSDNYYYGAHAELYNGNIVIQTLRNYLIGSTDSLTGAPYAPTSNINTAQCRVKVWKVGVSA